MAKGTPCERPQCDKFGTGQCQNKRCKKAHATDGFQNLLEPGKNLKRKGRKGDGHEPPPKKFRRDSEQGRS